MEIDLAMSLACVSVGIVIMLIAFNAPEP